MPELTYREAVRDALVAARCGRTTTSSSWARTSPRWAARWASRRGCSTSSAPERVRNTPISEMAIVGAGIGAAMQGMRPVVEVMYEDFLTLAMEQIVNQAAKHRYMSGGQLKVPLTVRTQGGAGWSPGAQHAQQLEAWFVPRPGLEGRVPVDARRTCAACSGRRSTTTTRSSSSSTGRSTRSRSDVPEELEPIPLGQARVHREGEDVTVIATGPARARVAGGRGGGGTGGHLGRGRRPAHAAAARRGGDRRLGQEDEPLRSSRTRRSRGWASAPRSRRSSSTRRSTGSTRRSSALGRSSCRCRSRRVMEEFVVSAPGRGLRRDHAHGRAERDMTARRAKPGGLTPCGTRLVATTPFPRSHGSDPAKEVEQLGY